VGLERGTLSLVRTIEELLGRNRDSGIEIENTAMGIGCADHASPLSPQKLALTSPSSGSLSVGIVRSRTKATEFVFLFVNCQQMGDFKIIPCRGVRHCFEPPQLSVVARQNLPIHLLHVGFLLG
jgi:hypothetical protein